MLCKDCRFWSERLAMSIGGGPVKAYCLVQGGPLSGQYTTGSQGCALGKSNQHGAIDTPGVEHEIAALYEEDDAEPTDGSPVRVGEQRRKVAAVADLRAAADWLESEDSDHESVNK